MTTEYVSVPHTEEDREALAVRRKKACAEIGKVTILQTKINERVKARKKRAETEYEACSAELRLGTKEIACSVSVSVAAGLAFYHHPETGETLGSRPLTAEERQGTINYDMSPPSGSSGNVGTNVGEAVRKFRDVAEKAGAKVTVTAGGKTVVFDKPIVVDKAAETELPFAQRPSDEQTRIAAELVVRFGVDGANRIVRDLRFGGLTAAQAVAKEEAREKAPLLEAPPAPPGIVSEVEHAIALRKFGAEGAKRVMDAISVGVSVLEAHEAERFRQGLPDEPTEEQVAKRGKGRKTKADAPPAEETAAAEPTDASPLPSPEYSNDEPPLDFEKNEAAPAKPKRGRK